MLNVVFREFTRCLRIPGCRELIQERGNNRGEFTHRGNREIGRRKPRRCKKFKGGFAMTTRRLNSARKSAPRIGWSTSARRNWNWKQQVPNCRGINLEPQALVGRPSAFRRRGPVRAVEEQRGNADLKVPLSTK